MDGHTHVPTDTSWLAAGLQLQTHRIQEQVICVITPLSSRHHTQYSSGPTEGGMQYSLISASIMHIFHTVAPTHTYICIHVHILYMYSDS